MEICKEQLAIDFINFSHNYNVIFYNDGTRSNKMKSKEISFGTVVLIILLIYLFGKLMGWW